MRTIDSSRALSHGFCTKSRAPRRIASTATSTVPHAVITTTGSVGIERRSAASRSSPSRAGRRVARVVQVDEHGVEVARLDGGEHGGRRGGGLALESLALEQQAQRLEHVALVVGDRGPARPLHGLCSKNRWPAAVRAVDRPAERLAVDEHVVGVVRRQREDRDPGLRQRCRERGRGFPFRTNSRVPATRIAPPPASRRDAFGNGPVLAHDRELVGASASPRAPVNGPASDPRGARAEPGPSRAIANVSGRIERSSGRKRVTGPA